MQFTEDQKKIIINDSNTITIGGPGTGKTTVIVAKVKRLITSGVTPESISIACFKPKSIKLLKQKLQNVIGADAKRIHYGTLNDLGMIELKAANSLKGTFADSVQMRRLLHQVRLMTGFKGSIHEAEHIVRNFKSKPKKPTGKEEFFEVFNKYQELLTSRGWFDRYDCLRQHLIAMRNDIANPSRAKYMFVDNAQDINYIQLLWLLEHANVGIKIHLMVDDDQTLYERSGSLGCKLIDMIDECDSKFDKTILNQSFRLTPDLIDSAYKIVSLADQRYKKGETTPVNYSSKVVVKKYNSKKQEVESLIANVKAYFKKNQKSHVAIITRNNSDAYFIAKHLTDAKISFADFSKSVWEKPGSLVIIDMLDLLLGNASDRSLKNILISLGLSNVTVNKLFETGKITGKAWLQNGCKVDKSVIEDPEEVKKIIRIQTVLLSYYKLRTSIPLKDIFKALCFELMKSMSAHDKLDSLRAIDKVLSFRGDMKENIEKARQNAEPMFNHPLLLGPIREFRNLEFNAVFIPFTNKDRYPIDYKVLGRKNSNDRRVLFTSMTKSKGDVFISYDGAPSSYIKPFVGE